MTPEDEFGPPEPIPDWLARAKEAAYRELPPMAPQKPATSALKAFDVASAKGIPILGGLTTKGDAAADAALDVLKGAISGPESVAAAPAANILQFLKNQYGAHLKERQGQQELLAKEHPTATPAGNFVGNVAGYAALPGAAFASIPAAAATGGSVEALDALARGEGGPAVLKRGLGGAAGGAAGAWIGKGIGNWLGRKADIAADLAATGGTQSAVARLDKAFEPLGKMVPGERAAILKEAGIVGGVRGPKGVEKGVQKAIKDVGEEFGGLIDAAEKTGTRVPVTSAAANATEAAKSFQANDYIDKVIEKHLGYLTKHVDAKGTISHQQLQGVLSELRPTASRIYNKPFNSWTPHDEAFIASYRALRQTQDQALEAALGQTAGDVRRYSATFHDLLPIAEKAVHRAEGNHPVGLIGEIQKAKGSGEVGAGLVALATGHPGLAVPMILKGALSHAHGALGKVTSPYKANVLTSLYSGLQPAAAAAYRAGIPQELGAIIGGGNRASETPEDEFGPPEPVTPLVAKKGK